MEGKVLSDTARKLGISSTDVVKKAAEFSRLVTIRGSSSMKALALSGSAKSVICLEIAAACCDFPVDRAVSIRLSGMPTQKAYKHAHSTLECMLNRQKQYTVRDLAVQFGCLETAKLAEKVLTRYKEQFTHQIQADFTVPVFPAAALYTVCRKKKFKIDKSKLLRLLSVKRVQFDNLCTQMDKLCSQELESDQAKGSKRTHSLLDKINEAVEEKCRSAKKQKLKNESEETAETDNFDDWKQRILQAAAAGPST